MTLRVAGEKWMIRRRGMLGGVAEEELSRGAEIAVDRVFLGGHSETATVGRWCLGRHLVIAIVARAIRAMVLILGRI